MSQEKPTIALIARLSGVSRGTVDRVLHNRPNVKRDKAERVRVIMEKLQYRQSGAAGVPVRRGPSSKLGVVFPSWPGFFEKEILHGIGAARNELAYLGYEIRVVPCRSQLPHDFVDIIDGLLRENIRGLALCAINSPSICEKIRQIRDVGIPVVTFNSDIADSGRDCFVGQNIKKTGVIAAGLMERITSPYSKIVVAAGNFEFEGHRDRVDGFREHWRGLGRFDESCVFVQTFNDYAVTFQRITEALAGDQDIGGVHMANDSIPACVDAIGNLAPARRVRIVGHDLSPEHQKLLLYGAVDFIIGQDLFHQGYEPVMMTARLLEGERPENDIEQIGANIFTAESVV